MTLHNLLDNHYGADGANVLRRMLKEGADPNAHLGQADEAPIHVAARRRRLEAIEILLNNGAEIDELTGGGKTAYAHSVRRGFDEIAGYLERRGASIMLNTADRLAVAIVNGRMEEAADLVLRDPRAARTGNPEEDRLLADVAGRNEKEPVRFLIECGADLTAQGLDSGTPLHQAAWFGQPANARSLINAGAPLEIFDETHESSPLGWAVHGSRYSGGAEERQDLYVELAELFIGSGARLHYPGDDTDAYLTRLLEDASPQVREVLARSS